MNDLTRKQLIEEVLNAVDYLINCGMEHRECPWCHADLGGPDRDPEEHGYVAGEECPFGKLIDAHGRLP